MKNQNTSRRLLTVGALGIGAVMALGTLLTPTAAQAAPYGINSREHRQEHRINRGVRNGELTRREAHRLNTRERHTNRQENRYRRSGGRLSLAERARLQHRLNQNSRAIYRQKHDRQDRH